MLRETDFLCCGCFSLDDWRYHNGLLQKVRSEVLQGLYYIFVLVFLFLHFFMKHYCLNLHEFFIFQQFLSTDRRRRLESASPILLSTHVAFFGKAWKAADWIKCRSDCASAWRELDWGERKDTNKERSVQTPILYLCLRLFQHRLICSVLYCYSHWKVHLYLTVSRVIFDDL